MGNEERLSRPAGNVTTLACFVEVFGVEEDRGHLPLIGWPAAVDKLEVEQGAVNWSCSGNCSLELGTTDLTSRQLPWPPGRCPCQRSAYL